MTRPTLRLVSGQATPRSVSLLAANAEVTRLETLHDDLVDALLGAPARDLSLARFRLLVAHGKLKAAENRRDRLEAEMAGERWLRVAEDLGRDERALVGEPDDGGEAC